MMAPTARKLCVNLSLFCMRTQKRERDTKHRENRLFVQGVSARGTEEKKSASGRLKIHGMPEQNQKI